MIQAVNALSVPLREEVSGIISSALDSLVPSGQSLDAFNSSLLQSGPATAPRLLAVARGMKLLYSSTSDIEELVFQSLKDEALADLEVRPHSTL